MPGMRLLHTADLHLKTTEDERWEALGAVLDKAAELEADALVVSGDMFDKHVEAQRLKTQLRPLFDKYATPVVILPGNHDKSGLHAGDFFGDRVTVLADSSHTVDVGDARIIALPFEDVGAGAVLERLHSLKASRREGASNIMLYHGELLDLIPGAGAFGDEDEREYMPVRASAFSGLGFDYILAGHFHRGYEVRQFDGGYFVYPGSPVSVTRKETGERSAAYVETGKPPRPVPLDTFHYVEVDVVLNPFDRIDPIADIRRRLSGVHPKAAVYLTVRGFVDPEALGLTEKEFDAAVRRFEGDAVVKEVVRSWRDVSAVMENELFKTFAARLQESGLTPELKSTVRDMVIDAMMETMHED